MATWPFIAPIAWGKGTLTHLICGWCDVGPGKSRTVRARACVKKKNMLGGGYTEVSPRPYGRGESDADAPHTAMSCGESEDVVPLSVSEIMMMCVKYKNWREIIIRAWFHHQRCSMHNLYAYEEVIKRPLEGLYSRPHIFYYLLSNRIESNHNLFSLCSYLKNVCNFLIRR